MLAIKEEYPTVREEIQYKVIETYEGLLTKFDDGLITMAQLDCGIKAIIATAGWCLDRETHKLIGETEIEVDDSFAIKRHFISVGGDHCVVKRYAVTGVVEIWINGFLKKAFPKVAHGELVKLFKGVCNKILEKGDYLESK